MNLHMTLPAYHSTVILVRRSVKTHKTPTSKSAHTHNKNPTVYQSLPTVIYFLFRRKAGPAGSDFRVYNWFGEAPVTS